jgi:3-hydroxypropanoate dehydrogenase
MAAEKFSHGEALDQGALDTLFFTARTHNGWQPKDIPDSVLKELHDTFRWGPTSANSCPARFVFVKSKEAKERLKPHLDKGNQEKTMQAPVTVLIGYDLKFYEKFDKLSPHNPAGPRSWFEGNEPKIKETAFRNSSLQGAYLIMAARALGLDCGPMSGFNPSGVQKEFFSTDVVPNFICSLGYGIPEKVYPRAPRFEFSESSKIV